MNLLRRLAVVVLLTSGLATATTAATIENASAARASCLLNEYVGGYRHSTFNVTSAVLSQMATDTFPPTQSRTVTHSVNAVNVYQAGAKVGGSLKTTLGNKWIEQAEAELHADFEASGQWSSDEKTTVTTTISNPTKYNATFVFFRGVAKRVTASVLHAVCRNDDGGSPNLGHVYWTKVGTFNTFNIPGKGAVRCGAGTTNLNSVARKAYAVGCA